MNITFILIQISFYPQFPPFLTLVLSFPLLPLFLCFPFSRIIVYLCLSISLSLYGSTHCTYNLDLYHPSLPLLYPPQYFPLFKPFFLSVFLLDLCTFILLATPCFIIPVEFQGKG
uniref:Uncharacterized protein n=1 Tax=Cacopsylla melanoneura TaxID=428564 RepID=A0A8D9E7D1_9HEMI